MTTQSLPHIRGIRNVPPSEFYTSGHRTCQGCQPALAMRLIVKAAGPRTIILGATGCMYVANTSYYSTPWLVPWMHTQLGSAGSAATGTAAGLKVLMEKGKLKPEPINVISICGDGGGADMGLSAISAALTHTDYNLLVLMYDNESYANTDIQNSGTTPWGANTNFSPPGSVRRIMHRRWKKNVGGMMAAGHPECRYVATACVSDPLDLMNKVRRALSIGGPTFMHVLVPCPKGWDFDPKYAHELGELAMHTGVWVQYEVADGKLALNGISRSIAKGQRKRRPVEDYLVRQGRFAHFAPEDVAYVQSKVDRMWETWYIPGALPFQAESMSEVPL